MFSMEGQMCTKKNDPRELITRIYKKHELNIRKSNNPIKYQAEVNRCFPKDKI